MEADQQSGGTAPLEASEKKKKKNPKSKKDSTLGEGQDGDEATKPRRKRPKAGLEDLEDLLANEGSGAAASKPARRRRKNAADGSDAEGAEGEGSGAEGRKGKRGKGAKKKAESESEVEVGEEEAAEWTEDLKTRLDPRSTNLRTAFSLKEFPAAAIRKLEPKCFLGGCRIEEGGRLLFDDEGKANMHFLLGTHAEAMRTLGELPKNEEGLRQIADKNLRYLAWLTRKSRSLRISSKPEEKRGKISVKRMVAAKKLGSYSLALEANLVEQTSQSQENGAEVMPDAPTIIEAKFPDQRRPGLQESTGKALQTRLKSQVGSRRNEISTASSHAVDMQKMKEMLMAPSLSFDWHQQNDDDEEGGLEVDIGDAAGSGDGAKRDLLRDQLKKSMSQNRAKNLTRLERSGSGLGRGDVESKGRELKTQLSNASDKENRQPRELRNQLSNSSDPKFGRELKKQISNAHESVLARELMRSISNASDHGKAMVQKKNNAPDQIDGIRQLQPEVSAASEGSNRLEDSPVQTKDGGQDITAKAPQIPKVAPSGSSGCPVEAKTSVGEVDTPKAKIEIVSKPDDSRNSVPSCPPDDQTEVEDRDRAATQDWADEISPTAMWCVDNSHSSEHMVPGRGTNSGDISPTAPFVPVVGSGINCVSPTAPFVPVGGDSAISPTAPFDPVQFQPGSNSQISPTASFRPVPVERPLKSNSTGIFTQAVGSSMPFTLSAAEKEWADEISPTAMWCVRSSSNLSAQNPANDSGDVSPTAPFKPVGGDVSPTAPFKPVDGSFSPTAPFQPMECEVSPTAPFKPVGGNLDISPTAVFEPVPVGGAGIISPTAPFVPVVVEKGVLETSPMAAVKSKWPPHAESKGHPAQAARSSPVKDDPRSEAFDELTVPTTSTKSRVQVPADGETPAKKRKRQNALPTQDLSFSDDDDIVDAAVAGDAAGTFSSNFDVLEKDDVLDENRLKQQREWMRQQRKKIRQEQDLKKQHEVQLSKKNKLAAAVSKLGTSMMSKEELSRYREVDLVGGGSFKRETIGLGLKRLAGHGHDDDSVLFGGLGNSAPKRRNFLHVAL